MFHSLVAKKFISGHALQVTLADVETLNQHAQLGHHDITKLSFYAYFQVMQSYRLLRVGAALGYGCGPLLVSAKKRPAQDLANLRIAIPGRFTTAHLLLQLWTPHIGQRVFMTYDQILPALQQGQVDCGVIIHESRFTYAQAGYHALVDLGQWWEQETSLPIPLGCIAAKKTLPDSLVFEFEQELKQSIQQAQETPQQALVYAKQHAQEIQERVLHQHIQTFVNDFSLDVGPQGEAAISRLQSLAGSRGLL